MLKLEIVFSPSVQIGITGNPALGQTCYIINYHFNINYLINAVVYPKPFSIIRLVNSKTLPDNKATKPDDQDPAERNDPLFRAFH